VGQNSIGADSYAIVAPVKELNDKADMSIEWKETKRGRSVHSLLFTFEMLRPEDKGRQVELDL
jgi:plasmid replication initiation protein